ncbi:MAG: FAD-dependent oxidoreductase [Desulforegulaceae bacterium]|nr:FAD-dependent oxidoreductase [Desulforegulaceae bacterium]
MGNNTFDIIIIGGGITGAGIFNELSNSNLKVLIIDKYDFGSGTSSKSSKLVHGGLRYLKEGNLHLTYESVIHREKLLNEAKGLVSPIEFVMPLYKKQSPGRLSLGAGLLVYDLMALKLRHKYLHTEELMKKFSCLKSENLKGGYSFTDAAADDSVLVARLVNEAIKNENAFFENYCKAVKIENKSGFKIVHAKTETGEIKTFKSKLIINSTGVSASGLCNLPDKNTFIRPLKGSHLTIKNKFNLDFALSFIHPRDKRPVFFIPWEGSLILGTTDIDASSLKDLKISRKEADYLIEGANHILGKNMISPEDIISTFSGIRPVISSKNSKKDPSRESREHLVWEKNKIISVTGGKLTTFRKLAWDTIEHIEKHFKDIKLKSRILPVFNLISQNCPEDELRLKGRYTNNHDFDYYKKKNLLRKIENTPISFAEIHAASKDKTIKHLDDLLLRRLRLGLVLRNGGMDYMDEIKNLSMENLKWDNNKWDFEIKRYSAIYKKYFSSEIN